MTDRQRQMIEAYIPSPPDPELEFGEYYMCDSADRVIKVRACSIATGDNDAEIREVITVGNNPHHVYNAMGEYGRIAGWYYMRALYDNKKDCRDWSHLMYDRWEELRRIQKKEGEYDAGY